MKRVPIKGGACKGLTAPFCKIWLWIQSISSFLIFALNLGQNSRLIFGLPRRFCENGSQWRTKKTHFVILQWRRTLVILSVAKRTKNPKNLRYALNLRRKIHALKAQTRTLNSWILHFATQSSVWQKISHFDKSVWQTNACHFDKKFTH